MRCRGRNFKKGILFLGRAGAGLGEGARDRRRLGEAPGVPCRFRLHTAPRAPDHFRA